MAKRDFYPKSDGTKVAFLDHFFTGLGTVGASVGVLPADITAISDQIDTFKGAVFDKQTAKATAQAATACTAIDRATEELVRAHVRRIKAHANYTEAIGEELQIEGPEVTVSSPTKSQPDLRTISAIAGEVTIGFRKNGFTGVEISCRRGSETEFSFLARDTEEPYVDTRANLTAGPETRYYRAQFLNKDQAVGQFSDLLVVTVPGGA
jgi:hypothetical protein